MVIWNIFFSKIIVYLCCINVTKLTKCVVNQIIPFHQLRVSTGDVLERGEYLTLILKSVLSD